MQQVEIRVKGHLDRDWSNRLGNLQITQISEGNTVLSGPVRDQAELAGLLSRLVGMGIQLISVSSQNVAAGLGEEDKM